MTKLMEIQDRRQCRQAFEPIYRAIEALEEQQALSRETRDYMIHAAVKQPDEEVLELFVEGIKVTEDLVDTTEAMLEEMWKEGEDARCFPPLTANNPRGLGRRRKWAGAISAPAAPELAALITAGR